MTSTTRWAATGRTPGTAPARRRCSPRSARCRSRCRRDRDGTFEPGIVRKRQRRLDGVDQIILSLSARGLTTGEIAAHFADVYGATVSKDTISKITDKVLEEMAEWRNRPLDRVYPVVFIDAIMVKVRDGQVTNRPVYVAIGVTCNGERDILGLWAGDGGEGAKFWLSVLTEIKNRGVQDVCIVVCDGLKGLPDSVTTTWPLTIVQTCVIHLLRNTFRYASRKYWDELSKDLRPIYTSSTEATALARFDEFAEKWGAKYPAVDQAVAVGVDRVRAVPGLRRGDPPDHLHHELHRIDQRPLPAGDPRQRSFPDRTGRPEMPLPGDQITRPDRPWKGPLGDALDESARGAVSALLPTCFPGPLAEPGVRLSTHPALHDRCRQVWFARR